MIDALGRSSLSSFLLSSGNNYPPRKSSSGSSPVSNGHHLCILIFMLLCCHALDIVIVAVIGINLSSMNTTLFCRPNIACHDKQNTWQVALTITGRLW